MIGVDKRGVRASKETQLAQRARPRLAVKDLRVRRDIACWLLVNVHGWHLAEACWIVGITETHARRRLPLVSDLVDAIVPTLEAETPLDWFHAFTRKLLGVFLLKRRARRAKAG